MATLITVHGTFAGGEERGEKWWQLGSEFERDVRRYVAAVQGDVTVEPFGWSGANSEIARRAAAARLVARVVELEQSGERYTIIGHSHGGSIIMLALLLAAQRRHRLPMLSRWITVGTPFVGLSKEPFLFSRVSRLGKSTLVTLATFLLVFGLSFYFNSVGGAFNPQQMAVIVVPFAIVYGGMAWINNRTLFVHRRSNWRHFMRHFADRWVALNHPDDEALQGLSAAGTMRLTLIPSRFALGPLTFLGSVLVPFVILAIVLTPSLMTLIERLVDQRRESTDFKSNFEFLARSLWVGAATFANTVHPHIKFLFDWIPQGSMQTGIETLISFIELIVIPTMLLLLAAYLLLAIITVVSLVLSHWLSKFLNWIALGQVRASIYGADAMGEIASGARDRPFFLERHAPKPLPAPLAGKLTDYSNAQIAKSSVQFRSLLRRLAMSDGGTSEPDALSSYLGSHELIHTCYFKVAEFRRLVAMVLSRSDGFTEAPELRDEPDRAMLEGWYEDVLHGTPLTQPVRSRDCVIVASHG